MKDYRKLVPRTPPAGLLDWAEQNLDLGRSTLVFRQVWVTAPLDFLDEWTKPRKEKAVEVTCSACGSTGTFQWAHDPNGGYGFIPVYDFGEDSDIIGEGDECLCPFCEAPAVAQKAASVRKKGYFVSAEASTMSAALIGEEKLLALTGWVIQRRVCPNAREELRAVPSEAYVFGPRERVRLLGWKTAYSGTAGYFTAYERSWRQPAGWRDSWEEINGIFGLTPELVEQSCLPHCKLDAYMAPRVGARHYPVSYLQLYQDHPNVEHILIHGLPRVLDDLLAAHMNRRWDKDRLYTVELPELDWSAVRPARMLHLTKDELHMAQGQDWGVYFWELFLQAKRFGEVLTAEDIQNAFCLGDDHLDQLPGRGPVGKSIRYLLKQCECMAVEDEDPYPDGIPDVQTLTDYWTMAEALGRDLGDPSVRFPKDLIASHNDMTELIAQRELDAMAGQFRIRRRLLSRYSFAADGLLIRPAASQAELTKEGDALHHCVSTYGKSHAQGKTAIFFLRRASSPGTSFYTLELDEKNLTVRQNRGLRNCARTPEVQAFEDLWLSWLRVGAPRNKKGRPILPGKPAERVRVA